MPTNNSHLIRLIRLVQDYQRASTREARPRHIGPALRLPPTMIVLPTRQTAESVPARQRGKPAWPQRVISARVKERK